MFILVPIVLMDWIYSTFVDLAKYFGCQVSKYCRNFAFETVAPSVLLALTLSNGLSWEIVLWCCGMGLLRWNSHHAGVYMVFQLLGFLPMY